MFEIHKSGDKTSSGEIGLDIRTHASPKVGQDQVSGGVSVLCWKVTPPFYADEIAGKPFRNYLLLIKLSYVNFHIRDQISTFIIDPVPSWYVIKLLSSVLHLK